MRLIPVKKRFVRSFKSKDGEDVEVRLVIRFQPKIHWMPEIYKHFGKDYGRSFLQREGSLDIEQVIKLHNCSDLTDPKKEAYQLRVIEEIRFRLLDACIFHHIKMDENDLEIQFLLPEY
uniref:Prohibitin-like protein n=1 Tax=Amoebophrya sp. ex Karlodinium veneficum TaxID=581008 RepID=C7DLQ1_9DINO|nr:prohibitin-like protein [Amoebophrya sp. ex Karlodinium veneficum]